MTLATTDRLDVLYALLDEIGLRVDDVIAQLRHEGHSPIDKLAHLNAEEVEALITDAERVLRRRGKRP